LGQLVLGGSVASAAAVPWNAVLAHGCCRSWSTHVCARAVPRWVSLCLAVPRADLQMAATGVAPCRKSRGTCGTLGRSLEYLPTQVPNGETESPLFLWPCFSGVMIYRCRWVIVFMPYAYLHASRGITMLCRRLVFVRVPRASSLWLQSQRTPNVLIPTAARHWPAPCQPAFPIHAHAGLHMPTSGARGCKLSPAVGATTWNSP
jgi:hypothetical protein